MSAKAIEKTISLYQEFGWKNKFSKIRFWDAPYIEVEKIVPVKGNITELGCGEGIFSNFMALSSPQRKITGIEIDRQRVSEANRGLTNTTFKYGDATMVKIQASDAVVMFHLLHHLKSKKDQEKVIKKAVHALKKNGKLIIVEVDIKPNIKYAISWFTDHFLVPWIFEQRLYSEIYFRKKNEWLKLLKGLGLKVITTSPDRGKPFTHIVFECTKT